MCLRRVRSHKVGISNIDFFSKKDIDNIAIFRPWQFPKFFGTMGYKCYKNPKPVFKKLFEPSEEINTQKDKVNDYPDPRYFTAAQFYKKNNIKINKKAFFNSDRLANLDESLKGKDIFNGDSMNIAEIMRARKGKYFDNLSYKIKEISKTNFSLEDKKIQEEKIEKLIKDKKRGNDSAKIETQLVKINSYKDKENNVNLKKIEDIRNLLKRKYGNRKNLNKIFRAWANNKNNKITINDAYKKINSLSIPINYDEAKMFITSASHLGNEYLNLEEFSNLIYEPPEISFGNINDRNQEKSYEKMRKILKIKTKNKYDSINLGKLKDFISERISVFNNNIKELCKEKYSFKNKDITNNNNTNLNLIDFNKFLNGILNLRPSDNFGKEEYIKKLFDEYKNKDGLLDMKYFGEKLFENNTKEFLNKLKDKNLEICKEQFRIKMNKLNNFVNENSERIRPLFFQKKKDFDNQIFERKFYIDKKLEEQKKFEQQLNSTIPSSKWIHHIYNNRREHFDYLNKEEHTFSAKTAFKQNNNQLINTRFGSAPPWKNTAEILIGDEKCGSYISEKDRFSAHEEISKEDKEKKAIVNLRKQNRIKKILKKVEANYSLRTYLKEEKLIYSDMEKNKRIAIYDEIMKNRNLLIE